MYFYGTTKNANFAEKSKICEKIRKHFERKKERKSDQQPIKIFISAKENFELYGKNISIVDNV